MDESRSGLTLVVVRIIVVRLTAGGVHLLVVGCKNRVDHVELVLKRTVQFFKLPDAFKQFFFTGHSFR